MPDPFPDFCFWDCDVVHAFTAQSNGQSADLGALPGGGSSVPMWISSSGLIAGVRENGETDSLYSGLPQTRGVLWHDGKITDLGVLPEGGYQSEANSVNSSGQVVGAALNTIPDPNSMQQVSTPVGPGPFWLWGGIMPPYLYQMRAFLWDEENGMQDLGTLPGGTDAQAILINEAGQVVGYSYTASTQTGACFLLATDSFIWEKGKGMTDLGGFGGTYVLLRRLSTIEGKSSANRTVQETNRHPASCGRMARFTSWRARLEEISPGPSPSTSKEKPWGSDTSPET